MSEDTRELPPLKLHIAIERIREQLEALPGQTAYSLTVIDLENQRDMTASNIPVELQAKVHQDLADSIRKDLARRAN